MASKIYNVLFLCTGNSARSILAEKLLNHYGKSRFNAYSAGSHPSGKVNPLALETLKRQGLSTEGLRSKSWGEFNQSGLPKMDFIFTVCDNAAGETCPVWSGNPITAHWGIADPAAAQGSDDEKRKAFDQAYTRLENRIKLFTGLDLEAPDKAKLKRDLDAIGKLTD